VRHVRIVVVAGVVMFAREAVAVCPNLHADARAYGRSTIAFVGEVIRAGAAPAPLDARVSAKATLASACPVQAQWSPPAGKACVIGVVTDRGVRVAPGPTHAVSIDGNRVYPTADGCFSSCGDPDTRVIEYDEIDVRDSSPADEDSDQFDVTLHTRHLERPVKLAAGDRRFVRVDLHAQRMEEDDRHEKWSSWQLDQWKQGDGVTSIPAEVVLVRVDAAWKGTCPHRQILLDLSGPQACRTVSGTPGSRMIVFANVDDRGLVAPEGMDRVPTGATIDQLRPPDAVELTCQ
jgi:hypothetical protein